MALRPQSRHAARSVKKRPVAPSFVRNARRQKTSVRRTAQGFPVIKLGRQTAYAPSQIPCHLQTPAAVFFTTNAHFVHQEGNIRLRQRASVGTPDHHFAVTPSYFRVECRVKCALAEISCLQPTPGGAADGSTVNLHQAEARGILTHRRDQRAVRALSAFTSQRVNACMYLRTAIRLIGIDMRFYG